MFFQINGGSKAKEQRHGGDRIAAMGWLRLPERQNPLFLVIRVK